jgi:hypothetical protein
MTVYVQCCYIWKTESRVSDSGVVLNKRRSAFVKDIIWFEVYHHLKYNAV